MKNTRRSLMKNYLKYFTLSLAVIILIIQTFTIITEDKNSNTQKNPKNLFENLTKAEYCQRENKTKYAIYLAQCAMAFFSGFLLSDMKFLKIGIM